MKSGREEELEYGCNDEKHNAEPPYIYRGVACTTVMRFEKRDAILVAGVALLSLGLMPFVAPILAIIGAAAVFFGIKLYTERRRRDIMYDIGSGVCAECGSAIVGNQCPQCDRRDTA